MPIKMTKQLNEIFSTCSPGSLSQRDTQLVNFAAQLALRQEDPATISTEISRTAGVSSEEIFRVACLCACTGGARVQDAFVGVLNRTPEIAELRTARALGRRAAPGAAAAPASSISAEVSPSVFPEVALSLDSSLFRSARLCSEASLDKKTTHLVGLTSCLVTGCACAAGHVIQAKLAGATEEELTRCACIAACVGGVRNKYSFLEARECARGKNACAC